MSHTSNSTTTQQHPQQQAGLSQREMQQQHRKSTSMDDINLERMGAAAGAPGTGNQWKSCSLQRGMAPPVNGSGVEQNPIYGTVGAKNPDGTLVIRRKASRQTIQDDEDPYGRCLNMKLTSFVENGASVPPNNGSGNARDPRIIDLTHSNASSTNNVSIASSSGGQVDPRQGSPIHVQFQSPTPPVHQQHPAGSNPQQFNTLPAQIHGYNGQQQQHAAMKMQQPSQQHPHHNTLPARVNGINGNNNPHGLPPQSPRSNANHTLNGTAAPPLPSSSNSSAIYGPTGARHFKPFDHRRMNPMAEIQENPYGMHESTYGSIPENNPVYGTIGPSGSGVPGQPPAAPRPLSSAGPLPGTLIVQKTSNLPHMPTELRHTNYSSSSTGSNPPGIVPVEHLNPQRKQLVNPQILEHHRDSANFSLNSSDSG